VGRRLRSADDRRIQSVEFDEHPILVG
jgi:hypothetical protein